MDNRNISHALGGYIALVIVGMLASGTRAALAQADAIVAKSVFFHKFSKAGYGLLEPSVDFREKEGKRVQPKWGERDMGLRFLGDSAMMATARINNTDNAHRLELRGDFTIYVELELEAHGESKVWTILEAEDEEGRGFALKIKQLESGKFSVKFGFISEQAAPFEKQAASFEVGAASMLGRKELWVVRDKNDKNKLFFSISAKGVKKEPHGVPLDDGPDNDWPLTLRLGGSKGQSFSGTLRAVGLWPVVLTGDEMLRAEKIPWAAGAPCDN